MPNYAGLGNPMTNRRTGRRGRPPRNLSFFNQLAAGGSLAEIPAEDIPKNTYYFTIKQATSG
jgi:hypothetical protein